MNPKQKKRNDKLMTPCGEWHSANLHYIPVHRQPYYENLGFKAGDFPEAEQFHREIISLPIYPNLGEAQNIVTTNLLKL